MEPVLGSSVFGMSHPWKWSGKDTRDTLSCNVRASGSHQDALTNRKGPSHQTARALESSAQHYRHSSPRQGASGSAPLAALCRMHHTLHPCE
eukprot:4728959-Amphidinium_carterae.5